MQWVESWSLPCIMPVPRQRDSIHSSSSLLNSISREPSPWNLQQGKQVKSKWHPILFDRCHVLTYKGVFLKSGCHCHTGASTYPLLWPLPSPQHPLGASGSHPGSTLVALAVFCFSGVDLPEWQFSLGWSVASWELLQHCTGARQASTALPFVFLNITMSRAQVRPWQGSIRQVKEHWPERVKLDSAYNSECLTTCFGTIFLHSSFHARGLLSVEAVAFCA